MNNLLEQIDLLRSRANVGYEEAKDALDRTNGDMVEALILLEKENKIRAQQYSGGSFLSNTMDIVKGWIEKGNRSRFVVRKGDHDLLNLSVTVAVVGSVVAPVIPLVGLPIALVTNHKIKVIKEDGQEAGINRVFDRVGTTVSNQVNAFQNSQQAQQEEF